MTALRVLLIEDDPDDATMVLRVLSRAGYAVEACRVEEAGSMRDALANDRFDVVIADHSLPRFDAPAALRVLRDAGIDLPFLIVSGSLPEDLAVAVLKAGAHDYIPKDKMARLVPAIEREVREADSRARRREAERKLVESEARYRRFFEDDLTGVVLADGTGRILDANPTFLAMFGFASPKEAIGSELRELWTHQPAFDALLRRAEGDRVVAGYEGDLRRRDGRRISVVANLVGEAGPAGALHDLRVYFVDVTRRREAEEQLGHAQKMEAVARLAGGIAHDFNNLLCAMSGYADLALAETEPDSRARGYLEDCRKAADRAALLTRRLLAFSRKQVLQVDTLDLGHVVADLEPMLRRLIREDIDFRTETDARPSWIRADRAQVEQVLMNLVVNARDAVSKGGRISVRAAEVEAPGRGAPDDDLPAGRYAVLRVGDDGTGMTPDVVAHLFEPFFTTKPIGEGTGLGLATVRAIVDQAKGQVRVSTEPGRGSEFRVYWPTAERPEEDATPPALLDAEVAGSETVLVVEDDSLVRGVIVEILGRRGYRVLEAADGTEALRLSATHPGTIDAVLSDVVMPGMHGPEVAAAIRRTRPEVRILFLSGYSDVLAPEDDVSRLGASLLAKPFRIDDLLARVRDLLRS